MVNDAHLVLLGPATGISGGSGNVICTCAAEGTLHYLAKYLALLSLVAQQPFRDLQNLVGLFPRYDGLVSPRPGCSGEIGNASSRSLCA